MSIKAISAISFAFALLITTVGLAACGEAEHKVFVSVHVLADGSYKVNGKPTARERLESEVAQYKPKLGRFGIGFQLAGAAPYQSVQYGMSVAQSLGADVGIVGNEKF